jgi:hypothetical protein
VLEWNIWRIVHAQLATPGEIRDSWSMADLESAHLILDLQACG